MKIQRMTELEAEMRKVARGEIAAPAAAAEPSVESAEALIRLLTPENRSLLRTIRDAKPQSVAELARLTRRAEPNLLRTLGKLQAFGLLEMRTVDRRRVPTPVIAMLHLDIDPYAMADKIVARPAAAEATGGEKSIAIRIAVVDDHTIFREGAIKILASADGIEVVGEGATAADALKVAEELHPDVMLLDMNMPGGGVEAAANIARVCPTVRAVMLTASDSAVDAASALRAGARGYILKGSSGAEVVDTVRAIFRGESYVAPGLAAVADQTIRRPARRKSPRLSPEA
ncbi:MAG TPA: response regulator [Xanthobacteraceae bacterium]|nr:response regulator [Xanthobacteraceae bacterium]